MIRTIKPVRALKHCQRATYATASQAEIQVSSGEFGVKVATQDSGSSISTLTLFAKAGSRYETKYGLSHYFKDFAFKNTTKRTSFRITREAELQGGSLSASSTRENIIYSAQFLREDAPYFIEALSDVIQHTKYAEYELPDVHQQVSFESSAIDPETKVFDSLHQIAFRQGLGNPLFASSNSGINITDIQEYAKKALSTKSLTFVGTNIDHSSATQQINELFYDTTEAAGLTTTPSKYHGGELRVESHDSNGRIAIGFEGVALGSDKEAVFAVLKHLLGGNKYLKWGHGISPLSKVVSANPGSQVSAFNFNYSDAGLFGVYVNAPKDNASQVVEATLSKIKELSNSVSAEEAKRAVSQAKFEILSGQESQYVKNIELGTQISLNGKHSNISERIAQLDKVTEKELTETLKKVVSSKPSVAVHGPLSYLPYADQFKL